MSVLIFRMLMVFPLLLLITSCSLFQTNVDCLTEAIYFEARGESKEGQIAVGQVIMNRVKSSQYPDTVCNVIHQPDQFSYLKRDSLAVKDKQDWEQANKIARKLIAGKFDDPSNGALYYHNKSVNPEWAEPLNKTVTINRHIFYK